jgi:hypothetical protein
VTRLGDNVRVWLNTVGNSVQELIVTDHYGTYEAGLENFNALNLPNLSMLFTKEEYSPKPASEDEWSDIDSDGSQVESYSDLSEGIATTTDLRVGSSLHVERSIRTVLDRLSDGGSKLTRLCLDLDFETQWVGQCSLHFGLF